MDRPEIMQRSKGVPHRRQGWPARPYAAKEREKYPDSPFTFTYRESKLVPPTFRAAVMTS